MKLKLVVLDLEIPTRAKRWLLRLGVPAVVLIGAGAVAYADTLTTWKSGDELTAKDLNANFANVQQQLDALVPPGTIIAYGGEIDGNPKATGTQPMHPPPTGWLLCNGDPLNGLTPAHMRLYNAISVNYGGNASSQSFNLPDLRGVFLRGLSNGASRDSGRVLGTLQGAGTALPSAGFTMSPAGAHTHVTASGGGLWSRGGTGGVYDWNAFSSTTNNPNDSLMPAPNHVHTIGGGDPETRPANVAINYIIKL